MLLHKPKRAVRIKNTSLFLLYATYRRRQIGVFGHPQKGSPGRNLNWKQGLSGVTWWVEHEDFRKTQTRNGHEMVMLGRVASSTAKSWGLFVFKLCPDYSGRWKWDENRSENAIKNKFKWKSYIRTAECRIKRQGDHRKFRKRHTTNGKRFTSFFCVENTHTFIILVTELKSNLEQTSLLTCPCHSAVLINRMDSGISPDNTLLNCSFNVTFGSWNQE